MKSKDLNSQQEKGNTAIIQRKKVSSFIKSKDDGNQFSPPKSTNTGTKKIPKTLQSNLETSLGQDFSNVTIHTNSSQAVQMNATAYTQNEQIHFAPGAFNPNATQGQDLIGHEFVHIAQQRAGVVQPTHTLQKGVAVNNNNSLESEADTLGKQAIKGETISKYKGKQANATETVQRKLQIQGVTPPAQLAFLQKINDGSGMQFDMDTAGFLKERDFVSIANDEFERRLVAGIHDPQTVILRLINSSDSIFVDEFTSGKVDVDDMLQMPSDVFKGALLHFIAERFHVPNYEATKGTTTSKTFNYAHADGLTAQEVYLREQYPTKQIFYLGAGYDNSTRVTDAAGNGTVDYIIDFTDVRYIHTQPIVANKEKENIVNSRIDIVR